MRALSERIASNQSVATGMHRRRLLDPNSSINRSFLYDTVSFRDNVFVIKFPIEGRLRASANVDVKFQLHTSRNSDFLEQVRVRLEHRAREDILNLSLFTSFRSSGEDTNSILGINSEFIDAISFETLDFVTSLRD
jgi:hypothetical protein